MGTRGPLSPSATCSLNLREVDALRKPSETPLRRGVAQQHPSPPLREQASGEPPGPLGPRTQKGDSNGRYQWRDRAPCPPPDLAPAIVGASR